MTGLVSSEDRKLQNKWLKSNKIKYLNSSGNEITKRKFNKKETFYSDPKKQDKGVLYDY